MTTPQSNPQRDQFAGKLAGKRLLITTSSFGAVDPAPLDFLRSTGCDIELNPHGRKLTESESGTLYAARDAVLAGTEKITAGLLEENRRRLKVISRCGVGLDSVDLDAAARLGIEVRNTPSAHVDAVAELALSGILASMRQIHVSDQSIRSGGFSKPMGRLLRGKTVGLIGFGQVAQALIRTMKPFGVSALAYDISPNTSAASELDVELTSLDEVLRRSDVVSLHVPALKGTALIGAAELKAMKSDALLVNTARGGLIDEDALVAHLNAEHHFSCYLDTFAREPYTGPLTTLPNTLLTAHIGSYAAEARSDMEMQAAVNLVEAFINGAESR